MDILEKGISQVEPMLMLKYWSADQSPHVIESSALFEDSQEQLFFNLVRQADLTEVKTREVPTQSRWTIDVFSEPIVQFTRCSFTEETIRSGRLYYITSYYDKLDRLIEKPEAFKCWAKKVLSSVRRSLKYDKKLEAYIGPGAEEMRHQGIKFI